MEIPVVCNPGVFDNAARDRHFALSRDVLLRWPRSRTELPDGYLFTYDGDADRFVRLARWAAAEHGCCPWATYSVELGPLISGVASIRLRVVGSAEGKAFLAAAYRYLEDLDAAGASPPASLLAQPITREAFTVGVVSGSCPTGGGCGCAPGG
jgi:hypothetical protein